MAPALSFTCFTSNTRKEKSDGSTYSDTSSKAKESISGSLERAQPSYAISLALSLTLFHLKHQAKEVMKTDGSTYSTTSSKAKESILGPFIEEKILSSKLSGRLLHFFSLFHLKH